ncbi:MAG: extracellular solute-binding protein [Candidatus Hydrogenedentes bacterium]|nr:extracellular solute-binding protein [Candidatus Hydrogenedentota bacterium]
MKYVFLSLFLVMSALSVAAWWWQPVAENDRIELVWCSDDNPMRREQIALFNQLYPQYRLKLDPQNSTMEKVIVQCLAGVGPDVFDCYSGFQLTAFVRSGIALDSTEALLQRGVDPSAVWPCLRPLVTLDGREYGHPDNAHAPAMWFNKAIFDEAGEPYPPNDWTWTEFIEIAQRLTKRDSRGRPVRFGFIGYWDWQSALAQWGANIYTSEGTRSVLDEPKACQAVQFMQDLIYKHKVMPTPTEEAAMSGSGGWGAGAQGGGIIDLFGAGRGAMAIGGRWWLCLLRNETYSKLRLGAVELPRGPSRRVFGGGRSTLVNAKSHNIEGALCFLEYLHSQPWNDLINEQADALAPVKKYNYTEGFLYNPEHPEEDYNAVWRSALENAEPMQVSAYVNGQTVDRILVEQLDMVKANVKPATRAMRDAARKINEAIVEQLRLDPELREQYYAAVKRGARPAWDREEDAP